MKKILTVLFGAIFSCASYASQVVEGDIKIFCAETRAMFNHLKTEYGETPIVYGQGFTVPDESMTLWINANTTSWTLLLTRGQETCIVGAGSRFTVIDGGKKI